MKVPSRAAQVTIRGTNECFDPERDFVGARWVSDREIVGEKKRMCEEGDRIVKAKMNTRTPVY